MTNALNFFQSAKTVLNAMSEMESEIRSSNSFSAHFKNLADRQTMTATGFENFVEPEPITVGEVAPEIQGSATIHGVDIRINCRGEYSSTARQDIKSLEGQNLQFRDIQLGFAERDLKFKANVCNGQKNYREFGLTGTTSSFHLTKESPFEFNRQIIAASEETEVGSLIGQLKASGGDWVTTFKVVYGNKNGKIKVDNNGNVYLAAKIDLESQNSFNVLIEARNGDQVVFAEILVKVLGASESETANLGNFGDGVAFNRRSRGEGYIMYSMEPVHDRFSKRSPCNADAEHFIAVVHHKGSWHYETKGRIVQFKPTDTDVVLAKIDFADKSIEMLQGKNTELQGLNCGYASGDFNVTCNTWKNGAKHGKLQLSGSTLNLNLR